MMNRKKEHSWHGQSTLWMMYLIIAVTLFIVGRPQNVQAQWTSPDTNGNINTTGAGNVGIGTTAPAILGSNALGIHIKATGVAGLRLDTLGGGGRAYELESISNGNFGLYDLSAGSYRLYVLGNGNVGIGTTSATRLLTLNAGATPYLSFNEGGAEKMVIGTEAAAPYNRRFVIYDSTAAQYRLVIDNSGNVGIGTTTPNASLQINTPGSATRGFIIKGGASQTANLLEFQDTNGTVMSSFSPGGTNTLNIGQNGYMGQIVLSGATIGTAYGGKIYFPGAISVNGGFYDGYNNEMFNSSLAGVSFNASTNTTPSLIGFKFNANLASTTQKIASFQNAGVEKFVITYDGKVGVGTSTPQAALDVNGNINVSGNINAKYQDMAEWVLSGQKLAAGTVVILDPEKSNQVIASTQSYDTRVAGVVSERPGIALGEGGEGKVLVATTGRVRVRVDASGEAIRVGDLLVTSDREGVAMKSVPVNVGGVMFHRPGTLIGKALEPLAKGEGEILVLLSLQ